MRRLQALQATAVSVADHGSCPLKFSHLLVQEANANIS